MSKIWFITGAGRGIGAYIALSALEAGHWVVATGRNAGELESQFADYGDRVLCVPLDVAQESQSTDAVARAIKGFGRIDVLVNNAGYGQLGLFEEVASSAIEAQFQTNVFGLIATTQALLPLLHKSKAGRIVNVSSLLGSISEHQNPASFIYEFKGVPAYNVSKSAVNAWTIHLAHELKDTGIKVNTIHPGYVQTEMNKSGDQQNGELSVPEGARTSVRLALIGNDGPTGGYYYFDQVLPW